MSLLAVNLTRLKKGNGSRYSLYDLSLDHAGARRQCKERSSFENINVKLDFRLIKRSKVSQNGFVIYIHILLCGHSQLKSRSCRQ